MIEAYTCTTSIGRRDLSGKTMWMDTSAAQYPADRIFLYRGKVEDTLSQGTPDRIAFLAMNAGHWRTALGDRASFPSSD